MGKYVKKPVVIEAVQFNGFDESTKEVILSERPSWLVSEFGKKVLFFGKPNTLTIKTLEGDHLASVGDYIIRGIKGELYPCKPDIFEMTYDKTVIERLLDDYNILRIIVRDESGE